MDDRYVLTKTKFFIRYQEIERENRMLLEKITRIMVNKPK